MKTWYFALTLVAAFLLGYAIRGPKTSTSASGATFVAPDKIKAMQFSLKDIKPLKFNPEQLHLAYETASAGRSSPMHAPMPLIDIVVISPPETISKHVFSPNTSYPYPVDRYFNEALIDTIPSPR